MAQYGTPDSVRREIGCLVIISFEVGLFFAGIRLRILSALDSNLPTTCQTFWHLDNHGLGPQIEKWLGAG